LYAPQLWVGAALQTPPPLQLETSFNVLAAPLVAPSVHDCVPHAVEPGYAWHRAVPATVLFPLQLPFVPQVDDAIATHIIEGSACPPPTGVQVPAVPLGGLHVSHTPSQA
jgi:hypothetical protein